MLSIGTVLTVLIPRPFPTPAVRHVLAMLRLSFNRAGYALLFPMFAGTFTPGAVRMRHSGPGPLLAMPCAVATTTPPRRKPLRRRCRQARRERHASPHRPARGRQWQPTE